MIISSRAELKKDSRIKINGSKIIDEKINDRK